MKAMILVLTTLAWIYLGISIIRGDIQLARDAQPAVADPKHAARLCADNAALESFWSEDRRFFVAVCATGVVALERVK